MRLQRLELIRYGKFTDKQLDFGPRPEGQADLHIVYGPNEAGKSTAMSAWLDLLYGIPGQSAYGFLHPYATMRIGAALDLDGQIIELARIKTQKSSLQDAYNAPLPEVLLQDALGGLDRASYQAMFSLDDDTLERGGESILASRGELGELLFIASAGISDLSAKLDGLRRDAEGFHKPGVRSKTELIALKAKLDSLEAERKLLDTPAIDYARLVAAEAAHHAEWRAVQDEQSDATAKAAAMQRRLATLSPYTRLQLLLSERTALSDLPVVPDSWQARLPTIETELAGLTARIEESDTKLATITVRLAELQPDPDILERSSAIADAVTLKSAYDEAEKDLGPRRAEVAELDLVVAAHLVHLGQPGGDARSLLLPASKLGPLRELVDGWSGISVRLTAATNEVAAAARDAESSHSALDQAGVFAADTAALSALLSRLRHQDPAQAERLARREAVQCEAVLSKRMAELYPWAGETGELADMLPPATQQIDRWILALDQHRQNCAAARLRLGRAQDEVARLAIYPDAATAGHVTLSTITAARARREAQWANHLRHLSPDTAAAFEAAMRGDDQISAQFAKAQTDAEAIALTAFANATAVREADLSGKVLQEAQASLAAMQAEVSQAICAMTPHLSGMTDPAALRDWLARRMQTLDSATQTISAMVALRTAKEPLHSAITALRAELGVLGKDFDNETTFDNLMAHSEVLCDRAAEGRALRSAAVAAKALLSRRQAELHAAQKEMEHWQTQRATLLTGTWLDGTPVPDVASLRETLLTLDRLDRATAEQDRLHDRIAKMEANVAIFANAVRQIGEGLDLVPTGTTHSWAQITRRLGLAQQEVQTQARLTNDLQDAKSRLHKQRAQLVDLQAEIDTIAARFGGTGLDVLRAGLARVARKTALDAECDALQQDIVAALGARSLDDALQDLEGADRTDITDELARLQATAEQLGHAVQNAYAALAESRRQLAAVGGDDAVARIETARQTVLMQIADGATSHLRRRLGILAVDHALRAYRDTHRSAMLERATAAFATISRGAYTGLAAQPEKDGEVLVAIARDGGAKLARDLSKGTRFQLYLALRVAGYHELARTRPPVPFIADDIMETFDDDRSAEAFALLAEMAGVGQVIYLTHHKHLCDIARQVCPAARFHTLS